MARPDSDPAKAGTPRTESNTRKHRTAATSHRTAHTTTTKRTKASKTSKGSNSNSTLPTTSFVTSTNSLETAPTSSIYQQSSSSIHWGPATTAHALSPEKTFSSASRPHSQTSGFSDGSKKAVIAATTIGKCSTSYTTLTLIICRRCCHPCPLNIHTLAEAAGRYVLRDCSFQATFRDHCIEPVSR